MLIPVIVTGSFPNKYPLPLAIVVPPDQPAAEALLVLYSPSRAAFRCMPAQACYLKGKLPPHKLPFDKWHLAVTKSFWLGVCGGAALPTVTLPVRSSYPIDTAVSRKGQCV